jgi:hypothetical protein
LANFKTALRIKELIKPITGTYPQVMITLRADLLVIF